MEWITLKAAEWLPDQPDFENPGATTARNCIPGATSYLPMPSLMAYSDAIGTSSTDWVRGATSIKDSSNIARVYAGDAGKLYELSATAWGDISVAGAYSGTATDERWYFAQYGNRVLATNYNNAVQSITPGSPAVALAGSPPRARYIAQVRDWVVLAYVNDGTARPNRVQWSGYNNAEFWANSVTLQAGYQDLYEGGQITGLQEVGGAALVLQETSVNLMSYTGPPTVWRFDRIAQQLGSKVPGSVIAHRDRCWWWGESDIWEYSTGQGIRPIAAEKVARWLFEETFDNTYAARVSAAVDPLRNLVVWAFSGAGATAGRPNMLLVYSWNTGRWSMIEAEADLLVQFLSPGYTLEGLDAVSASLDALPASLDSDAWKGGALSFAAVNADNKLATFSGTPYSATVETPELRLQAGRHNELTSFRPIYEGGSARISVGTRESQGSAVSWTAPREPNSSGECNVRTNKRFVRLRVELSGGWSHVVGVDAWARRGGTR